ncbi:MAG: DUF1345 domain-containing protein [Proteobacteria bacterium]|nr:DUF1345 domain-containing protein [Pseudomonadota bacterium]
MDYRWLQSGWRQVQARIRLVAAFALGLGVGALLLPYLPVTQALLLGWNLGLWLYLLLAWRLMHRADVHRVRRLAVAHAPGAAMVLTLMIAATVASIVAIVLELARGHGGWLPVTLAAGTLVGGWLLLPVVFTFSYASRYYHREPPAGLRFPDDDPAFAPRYGDIFYFSMTLSVAAQTSDVAITTPAMRRLALLHAVLAFAINATILAFAINIGASLLAGN